jgi:Bifunctional DNA primase/polymerase, N-terminal
VSGNEKLRAALAYASAGWPVHPCKPDSKEPDTAHGYKDATTDEERIRAWWRAVPERNPAIATGAPGPDVLDVDVKPDGDGWAALNQLKRAALLNGARALVRTRSGGLHVYFAGTAQPCGRLVRQHLDFKSRGGYVLAPPSIVGGSRYEVLDHRPGKSGRLDWATARRLLEPCAAPPEPTGERGDVSALVTWVGKLGEGNRNSGLFWAACRAAESGHNDELSALAKAAISTGLPETEAWRTVESAVRKTATR